LITAVKSFKVLALDDKESFINNNEASTLLNVNYVTKLFPSSLMLTHNKLERLSTAYFTFAYDLPYPDNDIQGLR